MVVCIERAKKVERQTGGVTCAASLALEELQSRNKGSDGVPKATKLEEKRDKKDRERKHHPKAQQTRREGGEMNKTTSEEESGERGEERTVKR
ncbi:hypothetical protein TGDOM2_399080 [Toxoplasma gondii GAB2-2007-GAL-DOM2]|uniref:Uncharacterized protein n=1 Tax=Toxoplasma gondii GAB2-2007-GAL-DOM2 TaxID=1130820 RepID=A0A086KAW2_TOXGO|nr:hypothetical protein TGDOM2_399080 [Toxoplasma gondii GAB2-2007-GAL-DOM2]